VLGNTEGITQVEEFLMKLKSLLCSDGFDINTNLEVQYSPFEDEPGFLNAQTLDDLNYTTSDVRNTLLSLTLQDYSETMFDNREFTAPRFRVFGKTIEKKEVYIKIKIRKRTNSDVFCISFHYSQYPMSYPFNV